MLPVRFPIKNKKNNKEELYDVVQFSVINPTHQPASFDLFNSVALSNTANTPYGFIQEPNNAVVPIPYPINFFPSLAVYPNEETDVVTLNQFVLNGNYATVYVPSSNRIYVASFYNPAPLRSLIVYVINPDTDTVVNTIITSLIGNGYEMVYNPILNRVYLSDLTNKISVIDCFMETETSVTSVIINGVPENVKGLAHNSSNNRLYATVPVAGVIIMFDCITNISAGLIITPNTPSDIKIWVDGLNTFGFVTSATSTTFYKLDCIANTIINTIVVPLATVSSAIMAYNSSSKTIYYINSNSEICKISMVSNTYLSATPTASKPNTLIYLPLFNVIFFDDLYFSSNVKVLDCSTDTIVDTIPTSLATGDLTDTCGRFAYDDVNNTIWVTKSTNTTHHSNLVSKISANNLVPYIVGTTQYNQFLNEIRNVPKCIRQIMFYTQDQTQAIQPFNLLKRDADGNQRQCPRFPMLGISINQAQPNISCIDFDDCELILDNQNIFSNYVVSPRSYVTMLFYYKEFDIGDFMSHNNKVCGMLHGFNCVDGNSRTETQLNSQYAIGKDRQLYVSDIHPPDISLDNAIFDFS